MPALRRTAFAALAAALALTYGPSAGAQTVVVGPRAIGVSTATGGLVTVPVVADMTAAGGASLGSITGRLTWRPAVVRFVDATIGTAGPVVVNPDTTLGQLRFALANAGGATGTPILVNVTLQALGAPNDTTLLGISLSEITAAGTFADLLPITTATSALFCVAGGRYGDLDGNDSLRSNDALFIVTHAVGLTIPYPTFNGDVDNDGKVDTRDALLVLSYVVGLPTAPFRVGQLNVGGCTVRGPASIAIQPAPPPIVVGDQLPLTAVVRDSSGGVTNALNLQWVSRDAAVASVTPAGQLLGVAAGTTRVVAIAAPGLMDSATVSVTSVRHTWWVDAIAAAGQAVELGSQTQPFATIQPAVNRAAPGDTVRVGVGLYGGTVVIRKPLVVIGDSTAAGLPRLRNGTGPGVVVDTAGTVRLSRLQIEDSQGGIVAVDVDTLELSGIVVARSRGVGISARKGEYVTISGSSVGGAVFRGIDAESTATLRLRQTIVDLIAEGAGGAPALALRAFDVDTVVADTVFLLTAGARIDSAVVVSFREAVIDRAIGPVLRITGAVAATVVGGEYGGAARADRTVPLVPGDPSDYAVSMDLPGGATVRLDSARIHDNDLYGLLVTGPASVTMRGDTVERSAGSVGVPVVKFSGVGSVTIAGSSFLENGYGEVLIEGTPGGAATASVDSSLFEDTDLRVFGLASFAMRGGQVLDGYNAAVDVDSTDVVSVVGTEIASTQVGGGPEPPTSGGPWAVTVNAADSVRADSLWIHDNLAGALGLLNVTAVSAYGNLLEANHLTYSGYEVKLYQPRRARLAQTVIDDRAGLASRSVDVAYGFAGGASVVVDSSTFWGPSYGVYAFGPGAPNNDTLIVRGSRMQPGQGTGETYISVYAPYLGHLGVVGNTLDTTDYGVYGPYSGSVEVRNNVIRNVLYYGVYLYSTPQGVSVSGNTIECTPGYYSGSQGITVYYAPPVVTANAVRSCASGIYVLSSGTPYPAEVRGNVVVGDSVNGSIGIQLNGQYTRPVLALNDVSAGRFSTAALRLVGSTIDSARVDSNTVHDGRGAGIGVYGTVNGANLRGNVIQRMRALSPTSTSEAGIVIGHTTGGARLVDNQLRQNGTPGIRLNSAGDTVRLDSMVVADDSTVGIQVGSIAVPVVGRWNYISRNRVGLQGTSGTVRIDSSSFEANTQVAASGPSTWDLRDNYWGSPTGPSTWGTWSPRGPLPDSTYDMGVAVAGGLLYSVGGLRRVNGVYSSPPYRTMAYDPASNVWTPRSDPSLFRFTAGVAAVADTIYVVGGDTAAAPSRTRTLEAFNTVANTWSTRAPMPTPRRGLGVGVVNGILYAIGGQDNASAIVATVEAYDPSTNTWATKAPLPAPRAYMAVASVGGALYVFGGVDASQVVSNTIYAYDPLTDSWSTPNTVLPTARSNAAAVARQNQIYVVGGFQFGIAVNVVEVYDPLNNSWSAPVSLPLGRAYLGLAVLFDTLYAVGGLYSSGTPPSFPIPNVDAFAFAYSGTPPPNVVSGVIYTPFLTAPPTGGVIGAPPAVFARASLIAPVGAGIVGATRAVRASRALPPRTASPEVVAARRRLAEAEQARLGTPPGERRP